MSENTLPTRTVGERGKDKHPRKKRNDSSINTLFDDNTRQKIVSHDLQVMQLGKLKDVNNVEELTERITTYFRICVQNAVCPTVAGFALSLGIDRRTLWAWLEGKNGVIKNPEVRDTLKSVYSAIAAQYEEMLTEGKIVPVSAFFLMKNNHGYKDQTEYTLTARTEQPDTEDTVIDRAMLLEGETIR